jgi:hypothetical protein
MIFSGMQQLAFYIVYELFVATGKIWQSSDQTRLILCTVENDMSTFIVIVLTRDSLVTKSFWGTDTLVNISQVVYEH